MTIEEQIDTVLETATPEQIKALVICMFRNGRIPDQVYTLFICDECIMVRYGTVFTGIEKNGYAHQ